METTILVGFLCKVPALTRALRKGCPHYFHAVGLVYVRSSRREEVAQ